ncbi:MAG: hypothetical protein JG776_1300 [Caloramator sp.]|jgi:hypothetical protein|uniref:hypothetical protein n=1 Tax=Caloramator sp. TaxID=1871330 RepID=UPI001D9A08DC|nr:hypothetical protein [Caloramator sp.]MBZ4663585.1 hypothetical protein [Caloramator sp.]
MKVLNIWDWKYKLLLSESTFERVKFFINDLEIEEQKIYKSIMDYYNSFYSFDVFLNLILESNEESKRLIQTASKKIDKALRVPEILRGYYMEKINTSFIEDEGIKKYLNDMLIEIIDDQKSCVNTSEIQYLIFGKYYKEIKKVLLESTVISEKSKQIIKVDDMKNYAEQLIDNIKNNDEIISKFGICIIKDYNINVIKGNGFAEWWDKDLTGEEKDLLVLYDNKDVLNKDDFEYTIYHEIYPGHGQFYNFVRINSNIIPRFDHGAMSLIEGWATYCEWNVTNTLYSNSLRERGKEFLRISLIENKNCKDKINYIYENKIKRGYTIEQAINSVLYFSQYPGFIESYYLGALCLEEMIRNKVFNKPVDFLEYLKGKTWGELFALWV